ncbi:MAG: tail fiber domain-containing protein [Chitinophagaceae bacterium]|nr:tail fiber domain-containing protein [Chitinophagaceae bacterium]
MNNTTGNANTAVGANALISNTVGGVNTAVGINALYFNTYGGGNTAIGYNSLVNSIGEGGNTSIGTFSLSSDLTGIYNTALGYAADVASGSLNNSTVIGYGAIVNNSNSIQLGNSAVTTVYAGTGTNATVITGGLQVTGGIPGAGKVLTSDAAGVATWQTPSGGGGGGSNWSLTGNTGTVDGTNFIGSTDNVPFNIRVNNEKSGRIDPTLLNAFYGLKAGKNTSTGVGNNAIGFEALLSNTTGNYNTAIGSYSLKNNINGGSNVSIGVSSLVLNTNGWGNIGIGGNSNGSNGSSSFNTGVGSFALAAHHTGNYNSGFGSDADVSTDGLSNVTVIGASALVNTSDKIRLGDVTTTTIEGQVAYSLPSDARFKSNISETVKGLDFIMKLRPVVYNFNTKDFQEFLTHNMPDSMRNKYFEGKNFEPSSSIRHSGFIAQEVQVAAAESEYDFDGLHIPASSSDNYSLAYAQFVVPLVKSVQELSTQNHELRQVIEEQKINTESLKRDITELKAILKNELLTNKEGSVKIVTEEETVAKLFQNAPNPFSQSTIIRYSIPANAKKAILTISNMKGIKIKEFDLLNKGGQSVEISGGQLPAGTYIYSLLVNNKMTNSKKMILTR